MTHIRRIAALLLCAALIAVGATVPSFSRPAAAASLSDLQSQLEAAKANANAVKSQIAALEAANAPYVEQRAALQKQINATQTEIDLYQAKIDALTAEIAELEKSVAASELSLKKAIRDFKQRLYTMYTSGSLYSGLEVLSGREGMADSLAKLELMDSVSRKDSEAMQAFLDAIDELHAQQEKLAAEQTDLTASQEVMAQKKAELSEQYQKINAIVLSNKDAVRALESKEASYAQMEKDLAAAIEKKKKEEAYASGAVGTGQFAWPVPGYYKLSEKYGYRICPIHGPELHKGIDISSSGIYGAKIVAADSGTVLLAQWYGGYGNCIMIDHGNGYVTLYGHMKSASPLKAGDTVVKGTTIVGYVGSTGDSTGPHLHFEIRKNGSTVDPMSFF